MTNISENIENEVNEKEVDEKEVDGKKGNQTKLSSVIRWLQYKKNFIRIPIIFFLSALFISLVLGIFYFFYFILLSKLWSWGFDDDGGFFSGAFTLFGAFFLVIVPIASLGILSNWFEEVFEVFANEAKKEFQEKIDEIERSRISYEEKLEQTDSEFLIPLITYSKLELETYYKIGLNQTQKSYKYSILAMWIGFIIIVIGIAIYIAPENQYFKPNEMISDKINIVIVASGAILEIVSGLFLWIYKNSMNHLTYFYNRQIHIHNSLFAFRIAQTMENSDEAKKIIVERVLNFNYKVDKR